MKKQFVHTRDRGIVQALTPQIPTALTVLAATSYAAISRSFSAGVNVRQGLGPPALGPDLLITPSPATGERTEPAIFLIILNLALLKRTCYDAAGPNSP